MATVFRRELEDDEEEVEVGETQERLRDENRRLAVTLGAFSAFIASKGMLEEAWQFIHSVHGMDEGQTD